MEEVSVPEGYQVTVDTSDAAHTILTNTHTPAVIDIPVTKIWNDQDNQDGLRPASIVVNLLANGEKVAQKNSRMRQIGKKASQVYQNSRMERNRLYSSRREGS